LGVKDSVYIIQQQFYIASAQNRAFVP